MEEPAAVRARAVTPKNQLINMACSCPSFVTNVELSTPYHKLNTVVSVEQKEFNNTHTILQIVHTFVNACNI